MDFTWALERLGDNGTAALGGLLVGLLFGFCAQRSRFCLRAATIEFWRGSLGPRTAVWLMVFGAALLGTQLLFSSQLLIRARSGNSRRPARSPAPSLAAPYSAPA